MLLIGDTSSCLQALPAVACGLFFWRVPLFFEEYGLLDCPCQLR